MTRMKKWSLLVQERGVSGGSVGDVQMWMTAGR